MLGTGDEVCTLSGAADRLLLEGTDHIEDILPKTHRHSQNRTHETNINLSDISNFTLGPSQL